MRRLAAMLITLCLCNVLVPFSALADGNPEKSIDEIRTNIRALEAVARDSTTAPEVASVNRELLAGKRQQLYTALGQRMAAMENYLRAVGASLDQREVQKVRSAISGLQVEMAQLEILVVGPKTEAAGDSQPRPGGDGRGGYSTALVSQRSPRNNASAAPAVAPDSVEVARPAAAVAAADASCPACLPADPPDSKKDFIIDARTGETSGKKKFGLHGSARIIVKEKNPFLFDYRVKLTEKVIVESAIADFFGDWPLFANEFPKEQDDKKAAASKAAASCTELENDFPLDYRALRSLGGQLQADDSSVTGDDTLRNRYTAAQKQYDAVAQLVDGKKKIIYDQNSSCTAVCKAATEARTAVQQYKPDLQQLTEDINKFKSRANTFQLGVQDLMDKVEKSGKKYPPACLDLLRQWNTLASGFMTTTGTLDTGVQKMTTGKKSLDTIAKSIDNVFSNPNAFYQVYTRGEFDLPTNVEVTVERKDITKDDAKFVQVGEMEIINFGGGARFAVAGGVVVSPLETINFKRVSALVNGQPVTVVGRDESSNSRILPMLMLHGRLMDFRKGPVSGLHMSLGVTAKPNDTGTNVEFLIGPSISFIEQRLFLTFGGYAGRRKQLEGNLTPGQVLPEEFTEDIPTSNHLVWKPGIALTYKFK